MFQLAALHATGKVWPERAIPNAMSRKEAVQAKFLLANMCVAKLHIKQSKFWTPPDVVVLGAERADPRAT